VRPHSGGSEARVPAPYTAWMDGWTDEMLGWAGLLGPARGRARDRVIPRPNPSPFPSPFPSPLPSPFPSPLPSPFPSPFPSQAGNLLEAGNLLRGNASLSSTRATPTPIKPFGPGQQERYLRPSRRSAQVTRLAGSLAPSDRSCPPRCCAYAPRATDAHHSRGPCVARLPDCSRRDMSRPCRAWPSYRCWNQLQP
jgi:hypothetical protein